MKLSGHSYGIQMLVFAKAYLWIWVEGGRYPKSKIQNPKYTKSEEIEKSEVCNIYGIQAGFKKLSQMIDFYR